MEEEGMLKLPTEVVTANMSVTAVMDADWMASNTTAASMGSMVSLNYDLPIMILVAAVLFVVIVATAFGNLLVGLALFKFRYLRTISNYLIGNLALSDFLLATTILPMSTVQECLGHWVFGPFMCKFWLLSDVLYCTASIWNLCIIAFDRFTATLYPLWYREKRSNKQAAIYVALVWIISTAICLPPLFGWNDLSQTFEYNNKTNVFNCNLFQTRSYVLYSASGSFFIPFFITFFLYVRIFIVLRRRMRNMRRAANKRQQLQQQSGAPKRELNSAPPPVAPPAVKAENHEMETTQAKSTNEGSGNTEELSSKSLFGSESKSSEEDEEEDDEEDSSSHTDKLLCPPQQLPPPQPPLNGSKLKNGLKGRVAPHGVKGKQRPLLSANVCSDSERDSDAERVRIVVTEDESAPNRDSEVHKGPANPALPPAEVKDDNSNTTKAKMTLNPFSKGQKKKVRTSTKRRYEQREMRATIRMAIIIAFFCGMWLGFFTIYVIRAWCPPDRCPIPREVDAFFFWLGYSNSSINPILYTIFNEEFRKAFQKILGCYHKARRGGRH